MTLLKTFARAGLHDLGGISIFRARHARQLRILTYHHFPADVAGTRKQCEHIRRHYNPVSMAQVADSLETGKSLPVNAVAVTIDDGYRDFFVHAFSIFNEFMIAPTVFLVSDFLDRRCWLWWKEVEFAIEHTTETEIRVEFDGLTYELPVFTQPQKARTFEFLVERLKRVSNQDCMRTKDQILKKLGAMLPTDLPEAWRPLSWDEVRYLAGRGIEFGAHTRTHPILASIEDGDKLRDEIGGSKERIEQELCAPVLHFSYPNGRWADIGPKALDCVRNCGFRTAVTTECGMNVLAKADPFQLRRIAVDATTPLHYFAELLAGFRPT